MSRRLLALALGIGERTLACYETDPCHPTSRALPIPRTVSLACWAIDQMFYRPQMENLGQERVERSR